MATSIGSYSVALGLNTDGVIDGSKLARKEVRELTKLFQEQETETEKYAKKLDVLERAYKSGAIQQDAYQESVKRLQDRMQNTQHIDKQTSSLNKATSSIAGYAKGAIAAYVSLQALENGFRTIVDRLDEIDSLAEKSVGFETSVGSLQAYQYALQKLAGVEGPQALDFLQQLSKRIGENELGVGKSAIALRRLGVDLEQLKGKSPIQQFETLTEAIQKIESRTEKAAVASKLFGLSASALMPVLNSTKEEYSGLLQEAEDFGIAMSDYDVSRIQAAQGSVENMQAAWQGMTNTITAELAPAIADIANLLTQTMRESKPLIDIVSRVISTGAQIGAIGSQVQTTIGNVASKTASGDIGGAVRSAFTFDVINKFADERYIFQKQMEEAQKRKEFEDMQREANRLRNLNQTPSQRQQQAGRDDSEPRPNPQLQALLALQTRVGQQQIQLQAETNRRLAQLEFAKRVR